MLFLSGPADMRGDGHALLAVFEHYMSDEPGTARNRMISTPSGAADASLAPDTAPALDATSQARQRLGAGQFDQAFSADSRSPSARQQPRSGLRAGICHHPP